jgi:hypothetical protein
MFPHLHDYMRGGAAHCVLGRGKRDGVDNYKGDTAIAIGNLCLNHNSMFPHLHDDTRGGAAHCVFGLRGGGGEVGGGRDNQGGRIDAGQSGDGLRGEGG